MPDYVSGEIDGGGGVLIRAYGEFWNPEAVEWANSTMPGKARLKGKPTVNRTDAWEQVAIYALVHDFRAVYIGRGHLGDRLKAHLTDRHAGRWDMFSWYGLRIIKKDGSMQSEPVKRLIPFETIQKSLEALAIGLVDPPLNRKREALEGAYQVEQIAAGPPRTVRSYLESIEANTTPP